MTTLIKERLNRWGSHALFKSDDIERSIPDRFEQIVRGQYVGVWAEQVNRYLQEIHSDSQAKEK